MIKKMVIVFLLSMTPWGEWAVAVPAGILMNLPFNLVIFTAFTGNLIPVLFICALWSKMQNRLRYWYENRQGKARSYLRRYGIVGLIILAPVSIGVYISTITALLVGYTPQRTIALHIGSLLLWGSTITVLYLLGIEAWQLWT